VSSSFWPLLAAAVLGLGACSDGQAPTGPVAGPPATLAAAAAPAFNFITVGWDHSCGVTAGNVGFCWGSNQIGQLGTGDKTRRLTPTPLADGLPFATVDGGNFNSCGVTIADRAYCWGRNVPNGTRTRPTLVSPALDFVQVSAGLNHFCGVTAGGTAYCRGANESGQLGDGTRTEQGQPVPVVGGLQFRQVSTSDHHTCGVTRDDAAYCWGDNAFGQAGNGTVGGDDALSYVAPTKVAGTLRFQSVSAGTVFTCGLTTDGRAYCWGSNLYGQLGDETLTDRTLPTAVHGGHRFLQLEAGNSHVCGVTDDRRGFCWGRGAEGQLGIGILETVSRGMQPRPVLGSQRWRRIVAGGLHSCGVTMANVAWCWGNNQKGQLGDGTTGSRSRPRRVAGT
jgi:alpha-tubulin suppressor-like RCC1 family protein